MFSSKRKTDRTNKQISISFPFQNPTQKHYGPKVSNFSSNTPHSNVVVLKAKYKFTAKNSSEMSVRKDDHLMLLKRHGNGWLSVQSIENSMTGLVPSSYMEIAINDARNPISREWLYATGTPKKPSVDHVVKVNVTHALLNSKKKVWYKVDAVLTTGREVACAKYHRDFQNLLSVLQKEINFPAISKLTESPPTVLMDSTDNSGIPHKITQEYLSIISNLNLLLDGLLKRPEPFTKSLLTQFILDHRSENLVYKSKVNVASNAEIINSLEPRSTVLSSAVQKTHSFSTTAPLEPIKTTKNKTVSTRSSPVTSTPTYSRSNVLYSSYLNQSSDHTPTQSKETAQEVQEDAQTDTKSHMVHSESMRTLDSITSLIQMFEPSSSDEEEENLEDLKTSPPENPSYAFTKKSSSSSSSLMRNDFRPSSNDTRSSNRASEFPEPSKSICSKSSEPLTPTLGQSNLFGGFLVKDYNDTSPLQPKMHQEYMLPMRKKMDGKDLGWSSTPGLERHLV